MAKARSVTLTTHGGTTFTIGGRWPHQERPPETVVNVVNIRVIDRGVEVVHEHGHRLYPWTLIDNVDFYDEDVVVFLPAVGVPDVTR